MHSTRIHPHARPLLALGLVAALLPACNRQTKPTSTDSPPATLSLTNSPLDDASNGRGVDIRLWVLSPQSPIDTNAKSRPFRENKGTSRPAGAPDALTSLVALADEYEAKLDLQPESANAAANITGSIAGGISPDVSRPLDARTLATLRRNGFRAFTIPLATLDRVRQRLRLTVPEQQQIIAFSNSRSEVVRGPVFATSQAFDLDTGVFTVEAGHVRMLLRSWAVPLAATGNQALRAGRTVNEDNSLEAAVRVELTPQAVPKAGSTSQSILALQESRSISAESAGPVFSRLTLEATLPANLALVVFSAPEQPETAPQPNTAKPHEDEIPPEARLDIDSDRATPKIVTRSDIGPGLPTLPTLGQALLTDALVNTRASEYTILVFIPRPPARYTLLK